ncbi:YlbF family regulator [Effusibacillus pohliae]|uniref:YlbF family regulator n=1 Tax=Effusibacillus pohliae TaxID=232270 RepID=UPI00035CF184|nr:YlbF family regulator [Effusibacillus pohliae]
MVDHNELWGQAYELGCLIADSPEVEVYKQAKEKMEAHPQIKPLLRKLRDMQAEHEKLQGYSQGPHLQELEHSINALIEQLDQFPEVTAFKQACSKVDELLQSVTTLLANCITGKVNGVPYPRPSAGGCGSG